jgi:hypothetical protein
MVSTEADISEHVPVTEPTPDSRETPATGTSLSLRGRVILGVVTTLIAVVTLYQMGGMFLGAAPYNTLSKRFTPVLQRLSVPWFQQNWMLFSPNPLLIDTHVMARARTASGTLSQWVDLSQQDYQAGVLHDPWPSREGQYELGYAWYGYAADLASTNKAFVSPAEEAIAQQYLRNMVVGRLTRQVTGQIVAIQLHVISTPTSPPSGNVNPGQSEAANVTLAWWNVPAGTVVSQ